MANQYLIALKKTLRILARPKYLMVAVVAAVVFLGMLLWLFSIDTLLYVFTLPDYPAAEKVSFFLSPFINSLIYFFRDPVTAGRVLFSVIAGIFLAVYVYAHRCQPAGLEHSGKGSGGFMTALIGSGCIAGGTSLLSPILIGAGVGATAVIGAAVGTIGYIIAVVLMIVAIKGLSERIQNQC